MWLCVTGFNRPDQQGNNDQRATDDKGRDLTTTAVSLTKGCLDHCRRLSGITGDQHNSASKEDQERSFDYREHICTFSPLAGPQIEWLPALALSLRICLCDDTRFPLVSVSGDSSQSEEHSESYPLCFVVVFFISAMGASDGSDRACCITCSMTKE